MTRESPKCAEEKVQKELDKPKKLMADTTVVKTVKTCPISQMLEVMRSACAVH